VRALSLDLSLKRVAARPWAQKAIGIFVAEYLRLVWRTTRFIVDPPDAYQRVERDLPAIIVFWHGQHFMMPFVKRAHHRVKSLISRHRDGEINAIAVERLGISTIRGSGDHGGEFHRKGGVAAFRAMAAALADGSVVAVTADVPKVSRVAGIGVVKLAREAGRPILPVAIATRNRIELDSWDRAVISLPFGRGAIALGAAIRVPADAGDAELERARLALQKELDATTARAHALVGRRWGDRPRG
jgi:lysophospholipid acyltransferase (LPLAT)-like uncharacterized protein